MFIKNGEVLYAVETIRFSDDRFGNVNLFVRTGKDPKNNIRSAKFSPRCKEAILKVVMTQKILTEELVNVIVDKFNKPEEVTEAANIADSPEVNKARPVTKKGKK